MAKKEEKTNVMRLLEQKKIPYEVYRYPHEEGVAVDGVTVAALLGQEPAQVYKTLVGRGASGGIYVFCLPVAEALDLKKAAKCVGEKSLALLAVKELLGLTGYVRGGCSPLGMKKSYPTVFHSAVETLPRVMVSAGRIGAQVALSPAALLALTRGGTGDLLAETEEEAADDAI